MIKNFLRCLLFYLTITIADQAFCQFIENFDDGDISQGIVWSGDSQDFVVNSSGELQLNTEGSGISFLHTNINGLTDDLQWDITLALDFSPSNNNLSIVYLYLNQTDLALANGYFIRIGENGSDDTVELYALSSGEEILIGAGELGIFAQAPIRSRFRVSRTVDGLWSLSSDISDKGIYFEEFQESESISLIQDMGYLGIYCKYTSSNADGFVFDDLSITTNPEDFTVPELLSIDIIENNILEIQYSEAVTEESALDPTNYTINQITQPTTVNLLKDRFSQYQLTFGSAFTPNVAIELKAQGIEDLAGNIGSASGIFTLLEDIELNEGDILINEILFNPTSGGEDFVELINVSGNSIPMSQIIIQNTQRSSGISKGINSDMILKDQEILAITPDEEMLRVQYDIEGDVFIIENTLPLFNDDDGNVSIVWNNMGDTVVLDAVDYSEDWHNPLIDNEGVSLERISISLPSQNQNTWQSASSISGFATPGLANSQLVDIINPVEDILAFENLTFSPDNDGVDDFLFIRIRPDLDASMGSVKIYDSAGRLVKDIRNNALFGSDNFVQWDGTNDEGRRARIGPYIVQVQYFDLQGTTNKVSKACVLAGRFD